MKILHIINVRWFNATAWYALQLAKLQKKHGHEVHIITIKDTDTDIKAKALGFTPSYINCNTPNPFKILHSIMEITSLLRSVSFDIINCHRGEFFIFFCLLRFFYPFALIRTRGDQRLPKKNWINKLLHKHCTDVIIATNTTMKNALEKQFSLEKESVYTILGGVDTSVFQYSEEGRKRVRAYYKLTDETCVLGVLGRLDWVKGQKELIEVIASIKQEQSVAITLLILGFSAGIEQEEVQKWIDEKGMQDSIYITGRCDNVVDYISALDVAILSSLGSETIARAALEILACNIPLLSTDVGVMPDILPRQFLIALPKEKKGVVQVLYRGIMEYIENKKREQELLDAQKKILPSLTEEYFYNTTQRVYEEAYKKRFA